MEKLHPSQKGSMSNPCSSKGDRFLVVEFLLLAGGNGTNITLDCLLNHKSSQSPLPEVYNPERHFGVYGKQNSLKTLLG